MRLGALPFVSPDWKGTDIQARFEQHVVCDIYHLKLGIDETIANGLE
jgi:hypothetical protein